MMTNPCKDCPDRHASCHSECPKYKAWKEEWDKLKEKERKENQQNNFFRRKY